MLKADSTSFYSLSEDEIKKYLSLLSKGYSTAESIYSDTLEAHGDLAMCFSSLAESSFSDDMMMALCGEMIKKYGRSGYYALLKFSDSYDVPERTTDKLKTGESDYIYDYSAYLLCPLKPQKGGIAYTDNKLVLENATPYLQNPVMGMIYPAFTDRERDDRVFVCAKANEERELLSSLFSVDVPEKPRAVAKIKDAVVINDDADVSLEGADSLDGVYAEHTEGYVSPSSADKAVNSSKSSSELDAILDDMERKRQRADRMAVQKRASDIDSSDGYKDLSDVEGDADRATLSDDITVRTVGGKDYYIIPADRIPADILQQLLSLN